MNYLKFLYFGAQCDMKLCGSYVGSVDCKKASIVSLRNYRALFLPPTSRRYISFCIFHRDLFPRYRKLATLCRSFVLFRAMFFSCRGTIVHANSSRSNVSSESWELKLDNRTMEMLLLSNA